MELQMRAISDYLNRENIELVSYGKGVVSTQSGEEEHPFITLRINEEDVKKWDYFYRRLNRDQPKRVAKKSYADGLYTFAFTALNNRDEDELLIHQLDHFLATLQRKFYKVAPTRSHVSLLIKPTHRCQLDCKYCYDKPFRDAIKEDMTMEILEKSVQLIANHAEKVDWIWHGGEATLVGIKWFDEAHALLAKYPMLDFEFSMMSNGINFNDEWLACFKRHKISPGTSYNSKYQARLRVINQEKEDKHKAKNLMLEDRLGKTLQDWNNDPDKIKIGAVDVITSMNYKDQIDIYEFYKKINVTPAMNHLFHTRQTEANGLELSGREYAEEFLKYFKYWLYDINGIFERAAAEALRFVVGDNKFTCVNSDCRETWLGINPLGDIYPCDRWYPDKYNFGNVFDFESVTDVFASPQYRVYYDEVQYRFDNICKPCGYHETCRGGCNASAVESSGSAAGVEPFYCQLYRAKFNGVYDILRDVDPINDDLNPIARQIMLENGFYSVKEIKAFMKEIGLDVELEYNPKKLLKCSEYQVFRGVNLVKGGGCTVAKHVNIYLGDREENKQENIERRRASLALYLRDFAQNIATEKADKLSPEEKELVLQ
jgi:uncharacterized protein